MPGPNNALAFRPSTKTAFSLEGTSATTSGTTANAIPDKDAPEVLITNLDTAIIQHVTFGPSAGPSAATTTTRMTLLPNSTQAIRLPPGATHAYFLSASGTPAWSMVSGEGF